MVHALLLDSLYVPLVQLKQASDPGFEYFPPAHALQFTDPANEK